MLRVTVPAAGFQRMIACRAWLDVPDVVVSVVSASTVMLVVPATAVSSSEVMASFTVSPHEPESSPVTGRARPRRDVYAVAMIFLT